MALVNPDPGARSGCDCENSVERECIQFKGVQRRLPENGSARPGCGPDYLMYAEFARKEIPRTGKLQCETS